MPESRNIWGEPTRLDDVSALTLVEPGCVVWGHQTGDTPAAGGVVVEVLTRVDPETGESHRAFLVMREGAVMREMVVDEADVDMGLTVPVSTAPMVRIMRRMAQELYQPPRLRKPVSGPWMPAHSAMARRIAHLDAIVMGR